MDSAVKEKKKKSVAREILEWVLTFVVAVLIVLPFRAFAFEYRHFGTPFHARAEYRITVSYHIQADLRKAKRSFGGVSQLRADCASMMVNVHKLPLSTNVHKS